MRKYADIRKSKVLENIRHFSTTATLTRSVNRGIPRDGERGASLWLCPTPSYIREINTS